MDTSVRQYDDFIRLFFLHTHRESSSLVNELLEESDQFRFLRPACLANLKGSGGLILCRPTTLLSPSLVLFLRDLPKCHMLGVYFIGFSSHHSFHVTFFPLVSRLFFILLQINTRHKTLVSHCTDTHI